MSAAADKGSRPINNPEIAKAGAATQFGAPGGVDPVEAGQKSGDARKEARSIRESLRYLGNQPISGDIKELEEEMRRLSQTADGKTTPNRMAAARLLERLIKKADPALASTIMDNMEGKLSQEIVLPPTTRAPTGAITIEEAEAAYKAHMPT